MSDYSDQLSLIKVHTSVDVYVAAKDIESWIEYTAYEMNMIDLSKYLNQLVVVQYRNGELNTVVIQENPDPFNDVCKYKLGKASYTQDGLYFHNCIHELDVVDISPFQVEM